MSSTGSALGFLFQLLTFYCLSTRAALVDGESALALAHELLCQFFSLSSTWPIGYNRTPPKKLTSEMSVVEESAGE